MKTVILGAACALGLAAGSTFAQAPQQQPQQPPPPPQQQTPPPPQQPAAPTADVSEKEINKFAEIYLDVEKTRNDLSQEMGQAESHENAQEVQAKMREKIIATIEEHGWSLEQYNRVATAISSNEAMREQAMAEIERISSS
jgi:hypothetical protein